MQAAPSESAEQTLKNLRNKNHTARTLKVKEIKNTEKLKELIDQQINELRPNKTLTTLCDRIGSWLIDNQKKHNTDDYQNILSFLMLTHKIANYSEFFNDTSAEFYKTTLQEFPNDRKKHLLIFTWQMFVATSTPLTLIALGALVITQVLTPAIFGVALVGALICFATLFAENPYNDLGYQANRFFKTHAQTLQKEEEGTASLTASETYI